MKVINACKDFCARYRHGFWILAYMVFYLVGFAILENAGHRHYHVIHSRLDDLIPFCEYFIIPYFLWFIYCVAGVMWFIFKAKDRKEYYQLLSVLAIGMTVFLVVSCIYPNMQDFRPTVFAHDNICTRMVQYLYQMDTPTNILPSIHVFNSMALFFAFNRSSEMKDKKVIRVLLGILTGAIVLSTMFLKQHSVVDVSLGILMSVSLQMVCERIFEHEQSSFGRNDLGF